MLTGDDIKEVIEGGSRDKKNELNLNTIGELKCCWIYSQILNVKLVVIEEEEEKKIHKVVVVVVAVVAAVVVVVVVVAVAVVHRHRVD